MESACYLNFAGLLGISGGLGLGYYVLKLRWNWPPANGLDRFLTLILPAAIGIEWIAGFERVPRWLAWCLRMGLAAVSGRILLDGSVYLSGPKTEWTSWQAAIALAVCGGLAAALWGLLLWLSERSPGISLPLSLVLSSQTAGIAIMLAGYIKGGAACLPLTAALLGAALASRLIATRPDSQAPLGIGAIGLFGLLFIGRFFGGLSTAAALSMLLAPLLCWATELSALRNRKPWFVGSLRLSLVAIPLLVVLAFAKQDFEKHTAPLLVGEIDRWSLAIGYWSFEDGPRNDQ